MTVQELIQKLQEFDPQLEVVIGAEGVFQGSPDPKDIYKDIYTYGDYGQDTESKEILAIWAN